LIKIEAIEWISIFFSAFILSALVSLRSTVARFRSAGTSLDDLYKPAIVDYQQYSQATAGQMQPKNASTVFVIPGIIYLLLRVNRPVHSDA
jgi:hypothetical protein